MKISFNTKALLAGVALGSLASTTAVAQTANDTASPSDENSSQRIGEIIVTAQKRSESINKVPMSISAVTGDELLKVGITDVDSLTKVVPGFNYTRSAFGPPVYTLRGVGFYETTIGAKPTVGVYVDEVSLPFSVMAKGATLDLERLEVLKGPQGTLFGQNATGGAINYIAAKPTQGFEAGLDASYGRFAAANIGGFVSGPVSDTVAVRLAAQAESGGAWQKSYTTGETLGNRDFLNGRFLVQFEPSATLRFNLNLNGWKDKGDEQAAQLVTVIPFDKNSAPFVPAELYDYPLPPHNNRAADWTLDVRPRRDNSFWQAALRSELDVSDSATLTSITAYSQFRQDQLIDPDGVTSRNYFYNTIGSINAFSQELRLSGEFGDNISYIIGSNYSRETAFQRDNQGPYTASSGSPLTVLPGVPPVETFYQTSDQTFKTAAAFGNIDITLSDRLTLHAGARYTNTKISFEGCTFDDGTDAGSGMAIGIGTYVNIVRDSLGLGPTVIPRGGCITVDPVTLTSVDLVRKKLDEDSVSWRAGLDFQATPDALLYANVSRGYKSGGFPLLSASDVNQFNPVTQESITAYEAGFKISAFGGDSRINGAAFYYDYKDKQLKGRVLANPNMFGALEALINVPKSRIVGAELQLMARPLEGLTMNTGVSYIDSKIQGDFSNITLYGEAGNFTGEPFAYTPKWQINADVDYRWDLSSNLEGNLGANFAYRSSTNAAFGQLPILDIDSYKVVDFRAGIESQSGWSANLFLRNAFNEYYWTNATKIIDTTVRYAGMPRTYGLSISYRYR